MTQRLQNTMRPTHYLFTLFALTCLSFGMAIGCSGGNDGPPLFQVSGKITLDGAPLPLGRISLLPVNGDGVPHSAAVVDGAYKIDSSAGPKEIAIVSYRQSATLIGPDGKPGVEQFLPEEYNSKTTLKETVTTDRKQEFNFELKSKK